MIRHMMNNETSGDVQVVKVPCTVYSRVTGYLQPVQNWNLGKAQEFKDRVTYDVSKSLAKHEGKANDGRSGPQARQAVRARRQRAAAIEGQLPPVLPTGRETRTDAARPATEDDQGAMEGDRGGTP